MTSLHFWPLGLHPDGLPFDLSGVEARYRDEMDAVDADPIHQPPDVIHQYSVERGHFKYVCDKCQGSFTASCRRRWCPDCKADAYREQMRITRRKYRAKIRKRRAA